MKLTNLSLGNLIAYNEQKCEIVSLKKEFIQIRNKTNSRTLTLHSDNGNFPIDGIPITSQSIKWFGFKKLEDDVYGVNIQETNFTITPRENGLWLLTSEDRKVVIKYVHHLQRELDFPVEEEEGI